MREAGEPTPPPGHAAARISCEVDGTLAASARRALAALGVAQAWVHPRRSVVLSETTLLPGLSSWLPAVPRLVEDPVEVFELHVPAAQARSMVLALARALDLFAPGRGAVYAEAVTLHGPPALLPQDTPPTSGPASDAAADDPRLRPLALLSCVVQRGQGNNIARGALALGCGVPTLNFGTGTGVRDRLGLLRIAIPADKEIVSVLVEPAERDTTLAALVEVGRLDRPGRGFIGATPVLCGLANPRGLRGRQWHSAGMDQVIAAIDGLKGDTTWRQRVASPGVGAYANASASAGLLRDRLALGLTCNEGSGEALLAVVMASGASGATRSRVRQISPTGRALPTLPGRELIDFSLPPPSVQAVLSALADQGAFAAEGEAAGLVEVRSLPLACTYAAA